MTTPLVFHPDAADELAEAAAWYDRQEPGLGDELEEAVVAGAVKIAERPLAWPIWEGRPAVRVFNLRRFPYRLPYVPGDRVLILAVAHMKRKPGYWLSRL